MRTELVDGKLDGLILEIEAEMWPVYLRLEHNGEHLEYEAVLAADRPYPIYRIVRKGGEQ